MVPTHRLDAYRRSFEVRGALVWNALPVGVRRSATVEAFKSGVKEFLRTHGSVNVCVNGIELLFND